MSRTHGTRCHVSRIDWDPVSWCVGWQWRYGYAALSPHNHKFFSFEVPNSHSLLWSHITFFLKFLARYLKFTLKFRLNSNHTYSKMTLLIEFSPYLKLKHKYLVKSEGLPPMYKLVLIIFYFLLSLTDKFC